MTIHQGIRTAALCFATAFILSNVSIGFGQSPLSIGSGSPTTGENTVQNGLFLQGKDSYRVVDTAGFRTAADIGTTQPGTVAQVGFNTSCDSCGTGSCDGSSYGASDSSCSSCSGGGSQYGSGFADGCAPPIPYYYVSVEGLYMDNDTVDRFSLSPDFGIGNFERELGSRITIGSVPDSVHGYEMSFVGPLDWVRRSSLTSPAGGIETTLVPGGGFDLADLSSFVDFSEFAPGSGILNPTVNFPSTFQSQFYSANYWSLEANRTISSGKFAKLLYGTRYINYDELYAYNSEAPGLGTGLLASRANNDLYGLQIGLDLLYPICRNGYTDIRTRAGAFINSASNQFSLVNNGAVVQTNANDTTELAGMIELGAGVRYQVGEILSLRVGTELWYLSGVASANTQFSRVITPGSGGTTQAGKDILMTGISIGAELKY